VLIAGGPRSIGFGDDRVVSASVTAEFQSAVPRIPASAGALIFDVQGRPLILKPNYKKGWTIPGGQIDAAGESPWEACRFLFDCGTFSDRQLNTIRLEDAEIDEHRFVVVADATVLLSGPVRAA
jgi:8-oxo-dGTP diphosphatase